MAAGGLIATGPSVGAQPIRSPMKLADAFKVADAQAVKIVRRITGRARFFRRAFVLMAAK